MLDFMRKKTSLKHIAVSIEGGPEEIRSLKNFRIPVQQIYEKKGALINDLVREQIKMGIPIMSLFLLSGRKINSDFFDKVNNILITIKKLNMDFIAKNQVKIMPIGKWYELPVNIVDEIKHLIERTRDFDRFFLNLYINYDGQKEIEDAAKIIGMKIENRKISAEQITRQEIKDALYTSYYVPPDLIIINDSNSLNGFLLWDSAYSSIFITNKRWLDFTVKDFRRIVKNE